MSSTSQVPAILKANEAYAAKFDKGDLTLPPARKVAIITCIDARIDPVKILGLELGDAHVIRNAGGRAAEALRSLIISQQLLGTREILVIHHTDCGMLTFKDADLQKKVKEELHSTADHISFLSIGKVEDSVREDVNFLKSSPLLVKDVPITGWIYDIKTGKLNKIV